MTITTTHFIRIAFDYPPADPAIPDWKERVDDAIFDLAKHLPGELGGTFVNSGTSTWSPHMETQCRSLHAAIHANYQFLQLLEAYGCTLNSEP